MSFKTCLNTIPELQHDDGYVVLCPGPGMRCSLKSKTDSQGRVTAVWLKFGCQGVEQTSDDVMMEVGLQS